MGDSEEDGRMSLIVLPHAVGEMEMQRRKGLCGLVSHYMEEE